MQSFCDHLDRVGVFLAPLMLALTIALCGCHPSNPRPMEHHGRLGPMAALEQAVATHDEDMFLTSSDRIASELSTEDIIDEIRAIRADGDFAYASFDMHIEDGLIRAIVGQDDEAVMKLFVRASEEPALYRPSARLLYTLVRGDESLPDLSRFTEADNGLGVELREALKRAEKFQHDLPVVRLGELQAVFDHMLAPSTLTVEGDDRSAILTWEQSPYNPVNWAVYGFGAATPEHPVETLTDRRVDTFWAPADEAEAGWRIVFPRRILLEHELAYGPVVLPGAKTSNEAFQEWGRPTRVRLDFRDGVSRTFAIDYEQGRPRTRVDFHEENPEGSRQVLMKSLGPSLLVKPPLRWSRWVSEIQVIIEEWHPGSKYSRPAVSEFAIGPPRVEPSSTQQTRACGPAQLY